MRNADLKELIGQEKFPSVSIFMPTHRAHPETRQDPIRLKNLLAEARQRLDAEVGKRPSWPIIDQLEGLADGLDWRESQDALALFANEDYATVVRLPFTLDERVTVDRTFETRDIVFAFNRMTRYLVLTLAEEGSRLFAATGPDLEEVRAYGFPVVYTGAPGATRRPDAPQLARSNTREAHIQEFYREVDAALTDALVDEPLPLVVLGATPSLSFFDDVTRHRDRIIAKIEGNYAEANGDAIGELAWPEVERWQREKREAAIDEAGTARGANLLAAGVDDAYQAARTGRGARLLVEEDYRQPAIIHRDTGAIELVSPDDPGTGPRHLDDALDELSEVVIEHGGEVMFVDPGTLADYGRVALILRY